METEFQSRLNSVVPVHEAAAVLKPALIVGPVKQPFAEFSEQEELLVTALRLGHQGSGLLADLLEIGSLSQPLISQFSETGEGPPDLDVPGLRVTMRELEQRLQFSIVKTSGVVRLVNEGDPTVTRAFQGRMGALEGIQTALLAVSRAAAIALDATAPAFQSDSGPTGLLGPDSNFAAAMGDIAGKTPELKRAVSLLADATVTLDTVIADSRQDRQLQEGVTEIRDMVVLMRCGFQLALDLSPVAADILGPGEVRRYLVLGHSADELRATGGFVSAVWMVTFDNGALTAIEYFDVVQVDDFSKLELYPPAPAPLRAHMNAPAWFMRDVSWEPDFPTTAEVAMSLFKLGQGKEVDGVIAINQWTLLGLVQQLGSIPSPDGDEPLTGRNFLTRLEEGSDRHGRAYADLALQGVLSQLTRPSSLGVLMRVATALKGGLDENQMMFFLKDPFLQSKIASSGWGGAVARTPADYLYVVDSNVGWTKSDRNIERSVDYEVDLSRDAGPRITLTMRYNNHSGPNSQGCEPQWANRGTNYGQLKNACYWNFWRAYLPHGSRILSHSHMELPQYSVAADIDSGIPGQDTFQTTAAFGKTVASGLFAIAPGAMRNITLVYEPPESIIKTTENGTIIYELLIQKQPGILDRPATIDLLLPEGYRLSESSITPDSFGSSRVGFTLGLTQDASLRVELTPEQ